MAVQVDGVAAVANSEVNGPDGAFVQVLQERQGRLAQILAVPHELTQIEQRAAQQGPLPVAFQQAEADELADEAEGRGLAQTRP
jgi:hypothetical protein